VLLAFILLSWNAIKQVISFVRHSGEWPLTEPRGLEAA